MGVTDATNIQQELNVLKHEVKMCASHERWLDEAIAQMQHTLRGLANDHGYPYQGFVTHADVRAISAFSADTVIAIKAPSGTTLEVPDPDEGMEYPQRRYQIYLKSTMGPVEVYLVSPVDSDPAMCGDSRQSNEPSSQQTVISRVNDQEGVVRAERSKNAEPAFKLAPVHIHDDLWAEQAMIGVNDLYEFRGSSFGCH